MEATHDNVPLDLEKAYKRLIAMTASRLKGYGLRWREWVQTGQYIAKPRVIGRKNQDKTVIKHSPDGEYEIHDAIIQEAQRLNIA